jgi:predicted ArsR family transcriptional regulator
MGVGDVVVDKEQQLTAVLADGTRYRIYRSIMERPGAQVTVAEIADLFGLHPNVARMHLGKLAQVDLLTTSLRKGDGGGRPARLYQLSDRVSTICLPPRRYELLASLAVAALSEVGDTERANRVCKEFGRGIGQQMVESRGGSGEFDRDATVALLTEVINDSGMIAVTEWDGGALVIDIRNCVFKEISTSRPDLVCGMHHAFFEGVVEAVSSDHARPLIDSQCSISHGDGACHISVTFV